MAIDIKCYISAHILTRCPLGQPVIVQVEKTKIANKSGSAIQEGFYPTFSTNCPQKPKCKKCLQILDGSINRIRRQTLCRKTIRYLHQFSLLVCIFKRLPNTYNIQKTRQITTIFSISTMCLNQRNRTNPIPKKGDLPMACAAIIIDFG